jgi:hypothetical protein
MTSKNQRIIPRRTAMVTITVYGLSGEHPAKITSPGATLRKHVSILSRLIGPTDLKGDPDNSFASIQTYGTA